MLFYPESGCKLPTKISKLASLHEGAVSMSHGYGTGRASMRVAESNSGANANRLAPNTLDTIELLSNMSWIGAYPEEVKKAL